MNKISAILNNLRTNPDFAIALRASAAVGAINTELLSMEINPNTKERKSIFGLENEGLDKRFFDKLDIRHSDPIHKLTPFGKKVLSQLEPDLVIQENIADDKDILWLQLQFHLLGRQTKAVFEFNKILQHERLAVTCDVYHQTPQGSVVFLLFHDLSGKRIPRLEALLKPWQDYMQSSGEALHICLVPSLSHENWRLDARLLQEVLRDSMPGMQLSMLPPHLLQEEPKLQNILEEKMERIKPLKQETLGVLSEETLEGLIEQQRQVIEERDLNLLQPWEPLAALLRVAMKLHTDWREGFEHQYLLPPSSTLSNLRHFLPSFSEPLIRDTLQKMLFEAATPDSGMYSIAINQGVRYVLRKHFHIDTGENFQVRVEVNTVDGEYKIRCDVNKEEFESFKQRFDLSDHHLKALEWMLECLFRYAPELDLFNTVSDRWRSR